MSTLISVVGPPASGKSWLRERLAEALALPSFAIDDERARLTKGPGHGYSFTHDDAAWSNLARRLRDEPAAIVETAGTAARYQAITVGRRVLTIECEASPRERLRRLEERVRARHFLTLHQSDYPQRLAAIHGGMPGALIVDTLDPASVERAIVAARAFIVAAPPPAPAAPIPRAALLSTLAPVDRLRALPYPLAVATLARLEATHGPEAVASLRYELDARGNVAGFWTRLVQVLPDPDLIWSICVFAGENGTGKTWCGTHLFLREILTGRAKRPRIICATGPAIENTIIEGASGIKAWLPPGVSCVWSRSKGYEGELLIAGVKVLCCSADAPGQAIGAGVDLDFRDDPAGWIESCGAAGAEKAWATASRSCREGLARAIVPTTPEGVEFLDRLLKGKNRGVLLRQLGRPEDNAGNLAPGYLRNTVADMREAGTWTTKAGASPFATADFPAMRLEVAPRLVAVAVAIDPARSSGPDACEVGIVGGGRDERGNVHVRHDGSAILDGGKNGWPKVAWDLAERLQREHPGAPFHFIVESNTGSSPPMDLLRAEERARCRYRGAPEVNVVRIVSVRSGKDKCARARLPAFIAAQGQVRIAAHLRDDDEQGYVLEGQLRRLTPAGKDSDRADAMVHLVNDLAGLGDEKEIAREATALEEAEAVQAQALYVAGVNARIAAMRSGAAAKVPAVMPVEGAPSGDARYAGPPARVMVRPQSWRSRGVL